jgi:hypothetical protein
MRRADMPWRYFAMSVKPALRFPFADCPTPCTGGRQRSPGVRRQLQGRHENRHVHAGRAVVDRRC